jgi:hypothetical protein
LQQNSHFPPLPIITDGQVWVAGATTDRPAKFFAGKHSDRPSVDGRAGVRGRAFLDDVHRCSPDMIDYAQRILLRMKSWINYLN